MIKDLFIRIAKSNYDRVRKNCFGKKHIISKLFESNEDFINKIESIYYFIDEEYYRLYKYDIYYYSRFDSKSIPLIDLYFNIIIKHKELESEIFNLFPNFYITLIMVNYIDSNSCDIIKLIQENRITDDLCFLSMEYFNDTDIYLNIKDKNNENKIKALMLCPNVIKYFDTYTDDMVLFSLRKNSKNIKYVKLNEFIFNEILTSNEIKCNREIFDVILNYELKDYYMKEINEYIDRNYNIIGTVLPNLNENILNNNLKMRYLCNDPRIIFKFPNKEITQELCINFVYKSHRYGLNKKDNMNQLYISGLYTRKYYTDEIRRSIEYIFTKIIDPNFDVCEKAIDKFPYILKCIKNQTYELCLQAVLKDGLNLEYVKDQHEEICRASIRYNSDAYKFIKDPVELLKLRMINFKMESHDNTDNIYNKKRNCEMIYDIIDDNKLTNNNNKLTNNKLKRGRIEYIQSDNEDSFEIIKNDINNFRFIRKLNEKILFLALSTTNINFNINNFNSQNLLKCLETHEKYINNLSIVYFVLCTDKDLNKTRLFTLLCNTIKESKELEMKFFFEKCYLYKYYIYKDNHIDWNIINKNIRNLKYIENKSNEICLFAIEKDIKSFRYMDKEIVNKVIDTIIDEYNGYCNMNLI